MGEIAYSWDHNYELERHFDSADGSVSFVLNKLYISPTEVSYKTSTWVLTPGVFDVLEKFWGLLQTGRVVSRELVEIECLFCESKFTPEDSHDVYCSKCSENYHQCGCSKPYSCLCYTR